MPSLFNQMLLSAREESEPQRILFMLAQSDTEQHSGDDDAHGTITPLMCVDKTLEELVDFASFINEADSISRDWNMIFIAAMNGENGRVPSAEEAEPVLNVMVNDLMSGADLSRYLILDRDEQRIEIAAES